MYTYIYINYIYKLGSAQPLFSRCYRAWGGPWYKYPALSDGFVWSFLAWKEPQGRRVGFLFCNAERQISGSHHPWKVSKCLINYTKTSWKTVNLRLTSNLDSSATSPQKCCNTSNASQLPLLQKKQGCLLFPTNPPWTGCCSLLGRLGYSFPAEMGSPTTVLAKITRSYPVRLPWWPCRNFFGQGGLPFWAFSFLPFFGKKWKHALPFIQMSSQQLVFSDLTHEKETLKPPYKYNITFFC